MAPIVNHSPADSSWTIYSTISCVVAIISIMTVLLFGCLCCQKKKRRTAVGGEGGKTPVTQKPKSGDGQDSLSYSSSPAASDPSPMVRHHPHPRVVKAGPDRDRGARATSTAADHHQRHDGNETKKHHRQPEHRRQDERKHPNLHGKPEAHGRKGDKPEAPMVKVASKPNAIEQRKTQFAQPPPVAAAAPKISTAIPKKTPAAVVPEVKALHRYMKLDSLLSEKGVLSGKSTKVIPPLLMENAGDRNRDDRKPEEAHVYETIGPLRHRPSVAPQDSPTPTATSGGSTFPPSSSSAESSDVKSKSAEVIITVPPFAKSPCPPSTTAQLATRTETPPKHKHKKKVLGRLVRQRFNKPKRHHGQEEKQKATVRT